jgi:nucleoside phosphorylase
MLAILAPMATELAGIRRSLDTAECVQVSLHVLGVGRQATLGGTDRVARARPDAILMVGFCGAAAPDLKTGDVHVARQPWAEQTGWPGRVPTQSSWWDFAGPPLPT